MGNLSNLYVSRSFQSLIHLATDNTASANLIGLEDGYGNPIGVSVNTTGDLSISGSFTASLQNGYVWVGNSSGKSTTVATSSFGGGGSVPAGTISGSAQITAFGFVSGSYETTGRSIISSSAQITALGFVSGSYETTGRSIISSSAQITSLGFVSSSVTASSLITASAAGANITFTKGDASQFTITVATGSSVSSSYAETASLATNALDIVVNVKNTTGAQINKGTVVRIIGATGDNALIGTASWTDDTTSANTLGFVVADIANDAFGRVMTQGTLLSVDTDPTLGYAAGDLIYLSGSGQYTRVKPPAPYHEVRLGQVLRAQQNNGSIYVLVQNGYELSELHDVDINTGSLANKDILAYDSASGQWENWSISGLGLAITGSNTFSGNQIVSGYVSASNGFKVGGGATALEIGDGSNIRFLTGSSNYYNIQLVPGVGDIAFSRDGASNTKVLTLAGAAGNSTTFQNNPVEFLATVSSVAINAPLAINSGISSNVDITGSLKINAASVSTNASFPIPFISASIVSKDSVDTLVYNPSTNQLLVSASTGQSILSPSVIQFTSGSGTATYSSTINKNAFIQTSESGYVIGISGNPSKIGAPSLSANTKPAIYALSSSAVPYVAIELENSQSFTDGRVTFHRNVAMLQNLEITGSLTASLTQGYVWVGNGNNRSVLVATSSFSGGGSGAGFPYTGSAQITGSLGVTGSISGLVNPLTISSNTASMDFNNGNFFTLQLVSGSITHLTATNIKAGQTINLLVKTDSGSAAASGSLTFSSAFKFAGGFDYTPTAITASQDLVSFVTFDTTQILAAQIKNLS